MIKIVYSDLFYVEADAYAHGCNTLGIMDAGIARNFKENYPLMFKEYVSWCEAGLFRPGDITFYHSRDSDKPHVINLATQDSLEGAEERYLDTALRKLSDNSKKLGLRSVAMPEIGTGLGGLEKKTFYGILRKYFEDHPLRVIVAQI